MATAKKAQTSSKAQSSSKKTNQGEEVFKKLFLAGLGLMEETNQRLHDTFNSLVKKGKTREPEIKRAVEDIRKRAQARRKDLEKKFQNAVRDNEIVKSKEFQGLLKKLEDFEKRFTQKSGGAAKKSSGASGSSSSSKAGAAKGSAKGRSTGAKKRSTGAGKSSAQKSSASQGSATTTSATTGGTPGSSNQ